MFKEGGVGLPPRHMAILSVGQVTSDLGVGPPHERRNRIDDRSAFPVRDVRLVRSESTSRHPIMPPSGCGGDSNRREIGQPSNCVAISYLDFLELDCERPWCER